MLWVVLGDATATEVHELRRNREMDMELRGLPAWMDPEKAVKAAVQHVLDEDPRRELIARYLRSKRMQLPEKLSIEWTRGLARKISGSRSLGAFRAWLEEGAPPLTLIVVQVWPDMTKAEARARFDEQWTQVVQPRKGARRRRKRERGARSAYWFCERVFSGKEPDVIAKQWRALTAAWVQGWREPKADAPTFPAFQEWRRLPAPQRREAEAIDGTDVGEAIKRFMQPTFIRRVR